MKHSQDLNEDVAEILLSEDQIRLKLLPPKPKLDTPARRGCSGPRSTVCRRLASR